MSVDLTLWEHGAYQRHAAIQVPLDKILRNHDIVLSAVGNEWFQEQASRLEMPHMNITDVHPLFNSLTSPTDTALVETCELGDYLSEFKDQQAMREIIKDLRSDKYLGRVARPFASCWRRVRFAGASPLAPGLTPPNHTRLFGTAWRNSIFPMHLI
jgi:hypothetical protein